MPDWPFCNTIKLTQLKSISQCFTLDFLALASSARESIIIDKVFL